MIPYIGWKNPLEDVPWEFETARYKITIYKAELPAVDPNIIHQKEQLEEDNYVFFSEGKNSHLEVLENYGVAVEVYTGGYDVLLIKKDFGFEKIPYVKDTCFDSVIFTDGYTSLEITNKTLENYFCKDTTSLYLTKLNQLVTFKDDGELFEQLRAEIYEDRHKTVKTGYGFYFLNDAQLKFLDNYKRGKRVRLLDIQRECEEPCLFAQFDLI